MNPGYGARLELCYEAFVHAGFTKEQLVDSLTGVFVGCATLNGISSKDEEIGPYTNIGSFQSRRTVCRLRFVMLTLGSISLNCVVDISSPCMCV